MNCESSESNLVYVARTQGDSLRLTVDLDAELGEIDITDWAFLCQVRDTDGILVTTITVMPTDPVKGVVELSLTPAETTVIPVGDHAWDLQATDTEGDVRTLVTGRLRIRPGVSS